MADALEVSLLTFMSACAGIEWGLSSDQKAAITGIVFAGILVGSLFWGIIADRFGRKKTLIWVYFIISVFGILSGLAPNYIWLIIFRALVGFGIGGANIPFDLLAEFLPLSHRRTFLVYIEYFRSIGSLFVAGFAWSCLSTFGWRFLTLMTTIPVILTSLLSILYLPESPRWLLLKGRKDEAERVVREAAAVNGFTMPPFSLATDLGDLNSHTNGSYLDFINIVEPKQISVSSSMLPGSNSSGGGGIPIISHYKNIPLYSAIKMDIIKEFSYSDLLKMKEIRNISIPLWILWGIFGFTYYGIIIFVSRLYSYNEEDDSTDICNFDYKSIFLNSLAELLGVFISSLLIDKCGRIYTQFLFYCIAGISAYLMGLNINGYNLLLIAGIARMSIMASSVSFFFFSIFVTH